MKQGFIVGKFDPLHRGHLALVSEALKLCDNLILLVYSDPGALVPGWQRYHWVKNTWPELEVLHFTGGFQAALQWLERHNAQEKVLIDGNGKWNFWGWNHPLHYSCLNLGLTEQAVTSTKIRNNPDQHWDWLAPLARPYYVQRIALVGPESCGKSYMAEKLAQHYDTVFVEEYGRTYCEKFGMDSTDLDFAHVAGGQLYREDEMALQANRVLFCDTDLLVTQIWSEVYFKGKCQPWIFWANHERRYMHFLLCAPDIPWVNDGLREFEGERDWMFGRLKNELISRELPFSIISGDFDRRWRVALEAVNTCLGSIVSS
ncbi:MAG: AAA family ATPase [Saprospiraceae bacterium]|nr:AAA family ATPase [Saprospiraceae bacterium]